MVTDVVPDWVTRDGIAVRSVTVSYGYVHCAGIRQSDVRGHCDLCVPGAVVTYVSRTRSAAFGARDLSLCQTSDHFAQIRIGVADRACDNGRGILDTGVALGVADGVAEGVGDGHGPVVVVSPAGAVLLLMLWSGGPESVLTCTLVLVNV